MNLMTTFGNEISLGVAKSIQIPHKNLILRYFQRANPAKSENDPPNHRASPRILPHRQIQRFVAG